MKLITKAMCILVRDSTTTFLLLTIKRSSWYQMSRSLLLRLLLLAIRLRRKLNWMEGGIIGRVGVTTIGGYLMDIYVWIGVSDTAMYVGFYFRGGHTDVNRISMTDLHLIMTPLFVSLDMFDVWLVNNNDDCLWQHIDIMMPFMYMRLYKSRDLS